MSLAHQGGWDETVIVLAPIAVLADLLWLANRRAQREADVEEPEGRHAAAK